MGNLPIAKRRKSSFAKASEDKVPITKDKKKEILIELEDKISKQKAVVFVDLTGIKVKDLSDFRKKVKKENNSMQVAKKTLFQIAFKKAGIEIDVKSLKGEIAAIFGLKDEISPAKVSYEFGKTNQNLKIVGGYFEKKFREAQDMIALAQIPPREMLLAQLVGSIKSPISGFVRVLNGNLSGLVQALNQISKTKV